MTTAVFRAPMRSRDDAIRPGLAIDLALRKGVCGIGGRLGVTPKTLGEAIAATHAEHGERAARRLTRFAAVPAGVLVWTRDADRMLWLGRLGGTRSYDPSPEALAADLVHVRPCQWRERPFAEQEAPASVVASFDRGGRNWQRIRAVSAAPESVRLWE